MSTGLVFNVQRYSVQDGPGIRTTVFLKGCPLRCAWCHNPEGISYRPETMNVETRCIRCGQCVEACSHGEETGGDHLPARLEQCELCGACVQACPTGSRVIMGERMTAAQVLNVVLQDRVFYEESGGGVTFSGGEPLAQPEFLRECLQLCRGQGIHTAVDTCGYAPPEELLAVAAEADLFLYDLKLMDEAAHLRFTGRPNRLILENLQALAKAQAAIWVRIPVIPGVNDHEEELKALAGFAASVPGVRQVNLLPYHANGTQKAERLGQSTRLPETTAPAAERMEFALEIFRRAGVTTRIGG